MHMDRVSLFLVTTTLLATAVNPLIDGGDQLDEFYRDAARHWNARLPVLVHSGGGVLHMRQGLADSNDDGGHLLRESVQERELLEFAELLKSREEIQLLLFVGSDRPLFDRLAARLDNFTTGIVGLIPRELELDHTSLQLNTRLFSYEVFRNGWLDLWESYRILGGTKIRRQIGRWTPTDGIVVSQPNIWERRMNLLGAALRTPVLPFASLSVVEKDGRGRITSTSGLFLDILYEMESVLNFRAVYSFPPDGKWGSYDDGDDGNATSDWNGMIGMLYRREADLAPAGLSLTSARVRAVDMSMPLAQEVNTLVAPAKRITPATRYGLYVGVFRLDSWAAVATMVILLSLAFGCIHRVSEGLLYLADEPNRLGFLDGVHICVAMLTQQGIDVVASCLSARVLVFSAATATYLLYCRYTADLTSWMTVRPESAVGSFRDVLDRDMKIVVEESTFQYDYLRSGRPGTDMRAVYAQMSADPAFSFQLTASEALSIIAERDDVLFFTSNWFVTNDPRFVALKLVESKKVPLAWAYQKRSELTEMFDYHLFKLEQSGLMERLVAKWTMYETSSTATAASVKGSSKRIVDGDTTARSLGFHTTYFLFSTLAMGVAVGIILAACEKLRQYYYISKRNR